MKKTELKKMIREEITLLEKELIRESSLRKLTSNNISEHEKTIESLGGKDRLKRALSVGKAIEKKYKSKIINIYLEGDKPYISLWYDLKDGITLVATLDSDGDGFKGITVILIGRYNLSMNDYDDASSREEIVDSMIKNGWKKTKRIIAAKSLVKKIKTKWSGVKGYDGVIRAIMYDKELLYDTFEKEYKKFIDSLLNSLEKLAK